MKLFGATFVVFAMLSGVNHARADDQNGIDWSGFYLGAQGGFGFVKASEHNDFNGDGSFLYDSSASLNGLFGGIHAGYNFQTASNLVFGFEADANLGDHSRADVVSTENGVIYLSELDRYDIKAFGSGRLRIGIVTGKFMPFIAGGLAVANFDTGFVPGTGLQSGKGSGTAIGFTLGGGVEYAVSDNIRIRGEYRYSDYGRTNVAVKTSIVPVPTTTYETRLKSHNMSVGVSFAF
jgi:outer membrane immunogenic protein